MSTRPHGTRAKYVAEKCRCEPCTEANRIYNRERERRQTRIRYGIEAPSSKYVDPTEAREHLEWLRSIGIGTRTIEQRSGIGRTAITKILAGDRGRIHADTAARILAVGRSAQPRSTLVDARPSWELIDDLLYLGFTRTRIAHELGATRPALQLGRRQITLRNARKVQAVYQRLLCETEDWHGLITAYARRKCRCLRCRTTARENQRAMRERRRETAA